MDRKVEINISTVITIVSIIFTAGIAYGQLKSLEEHVDTVERRLEKKIQIIDKLEENLDGLKHELIVLQTKLSVKEDSTK